MSEVGLVAMPASKRMANKATFRLKPSKRLKPSRLGISRFRASRPKVADGTDSMYSLAIAALAGYLSCFYRAGLAHYLLHCLPQGHSLKRRA